MHIEELCLQLAVIQLTKDICLGVNEIFDSFLIPLGPGDLLAHHAISLALHVTSLIVLKGSLDGCGSKLMPDKLHLGFGYACDGPGRGGTCDLSAWDTSYLAIFWLLNTCAWITFYFHWKHLYLAKDINIPRCLS